MKVKTPKLILVLTALLFCYGFMVGGQQLVLATVCDQFGIGIVGVGTMVAVLHVASMLTPGIMGAVADRVGKKKVLVIFTVLYGIGCLVAGVAPVLAVFTLSMLIIGAGYSVCESLTSAVCVEVSAEHGARYINLTQCLLSVGAILGPIVMGNLPRMPFDSWRLLYFICGVPLLAIGILLSRMEFPVADIAKEVKTSARQLWLSPIFLCLIASMFLYVGLETGFGYFVESLFAQKVSGATLGAYGISAYWAGMAISRFVYSLWTYRPRRTVRLSLLAAAAAFVALVIVKSGGLCVVLCALVGFTYGPVWTSIVAGAAQRFPQHKASATGLMSAACGLSGIIYPMFMGILVDSLDIRIGFFILAGTASIGAILAFSLHNDTKSN